MSKVTSKYSAMANDAVVGAVAVAEKEGTLIPLPQESVLEIFTLILNKVF